MVDNSRERVRALLKDPAKWVRYCQLNNQYRKDGLSMSDAHKRALSEVENSEPVSVPGKISSSNNYGEVTMEEKQALDGLNDGKNRNHREVIEWIYNNIGVKDVSLADAPTVGAYSHLKMIQADPILKAEFYKSIWIKILPKNDMMEEFMARMNDDGTKVFGVIDKALEAVRSYK